ncbi:MAG: tetratricopeptide repeat protein [Candidatus Bathyarchaeota archaeon]
MSSRKPKVVVPPARPIARKAIELIDRIEEMSLLREAVDRAIHGEGGVVFLYGEAGIGKTRLARELGAYARSRGLQALFGRCPALFKMDGVPPYILWEEVIRGYLEVATPEQLFRVIGSYPVEVSKLVPELKQKLRTFPQSFPLSPEHSRDRLFEAVSQFIINVSREAPLLVVLDDLQWTDKSSLLLLHYLARGVYKESLLLLGAYRDTYVDDRHPLSPVLTELNRERLLQSVPLKRFSFEDTSDMIKRILEQEDVKREFCQLVYEKTRGNPFFVEEVIKSLREERIIYVEKNRLKIGEVSRIEFPKTVKSVIKRRIGRVDDESQKVLTLASFVGKDFSFEALREITGIEEDELLEIIENILKTGLFKHDVIRGEDVCSFADIIVRDVVYEDVSPFRRKRLHNAVGGALEKFYANKINEHFGELAYHFLESGDKDKARDYFLKAAEKAGEVYAYDEAFSYLQHALELLEEKDSNLEERVRLVERLGDLKGWLGESDACFEYWNRSLALWDKLEDKKNFARLHVKMASLFWIWAADKEKASEHHNVALEILEKEPESTELASLYEDISHMLWRTGESEKALPWTHKALELAEKLNDPRVLARCYNDLGVLSLKSGEYEDATKYFEQGLKIDLESELLQDALTIYNNLSELYWLVAEYQRGFKTAEEGVQLAEKIGALGSFSWVSSTLAWFYIQMGELQKAISMLEDLSSLDKRIKFTAHVSYAMWGLGECYYWLGDLDKSLHLLMEARDIARKTKEYQASGMTTFSLGRLFVEMEDFAEAEKYLKESDNICEKAGETEFQRNWVFPALSKLYLRKGEVEKAKELIQSTYEFATRANSRSAIPCAQMLKGMLFRELREWEQSEQHFEKGLQGYRSINAQKWSVQQLAELLFEYGLMHLNRNKTGDKEKGLSLLNKALEIYQKMDAKKKVEKTKTKMIQLDAKREVVEPERVAVKVPKAIPEHITTGYGDLDDLLSGGIPKNYAVMLSSPSCDERDLLIKRFLEAGAKEGQITFHVITKASGAIDLAEKFRQSLYVFICNPQADKIVKSLPNVFKLKGVENLNDINIALNSAFRRLEATPKKPRRACIEIVSDVLLQHHAVQTRKWVNALIPDLKSRGFTILAIMDPEMHAPQEVRAILDVFDGEINIHRKGTGKALKIEKMINQEYLDSELPLKKEKLKR